MRFLILAVFTLPGCHARHEATSGNEFFRKIRTAALARDTDTMLRMMTREARDRLLNLARMRIRIAEGRTDAPPLPTQDPQALIPHLMREWLDLKAKELEQTEYVDASTQDLPMMGRMTTVTFRHPGADRDILMLIEVDGYLKLWQTGAFFAGMGFEEPERPQPAPAEEPE